MSQIQNCPLCSGDNTLMVETTTENDRTREHYLCMQCGFTTTSDMVVGSDYLEKAKKNSPNLVNDLSVADNVRNLVWFPSIINIPEKGICYPDGVPKNWKWVVAPYKKLTNEERSAYLSEDDPDKFKWRLAIEKSKQFSPLDFQNAMAYFGALVENYNA